MHSPSSRGFSLVELSIVLVILGLLVGGVLSGQSLIHAAEIRNVIEEHDKYATALNSFKDKYFMMPGDLPTATSIWGKDNTNCPGNPGTASPNGVCNGDGDGQISPAEGFEFWRELANAGFIEGTYTGVIGLGLTSTVRGSNVPASKLGNADWTYDYSIVQPTMATGGVADMFMIGGDTGPPTNTNPVMTPADAWNIDTKMDDGVSGTGKVGTVDWSGNCANAFVANYPYLLTYTNISCYLFFLDQ
jgi:prepilin-type N-terminal cleavage/methylation domain-containing protein